MKAQLAPKEKIKIDRTLCIGSLLVAMLKGNAKINPAASLVDMVLHRVCTWPDITLLNKLPEFDGIATDSQKEMTAFCTKHGIDRIVIGGSDRMVAVGYFNLAAKWLKAGKEGILVVDGKRYKSAKLKRKDADWQQRQCDGFDIVFTIPTKQGYFIHIGAPNVATMLAIRNAPSFLFDFSTSLHPNSSYTDEDYTTIEFPQVEIKESNKLSVGSDTSITDNVKIQGNPVAEAEQFNSLKLTHLGADAKSITVMRTKSIERETVFQFTDTFVVWITHSTQLNSMPLFAAVAHKDSWLKHKS